MDKKNKTKSEHERHCTPNPLKPDYVPEKRDMLGKLVQDAMSKPQGHVEVNELGNEMTDKYMMELFTTVEAGKKVYKDDFFVVVLTKREFVLTNVLRNFFLYRQSCPTPNYDQAVYHYQKKDNKLVLLWVIPDREFSFHIKDNILSLDKEFKDLSQFVLDFADGTLMKLAKKLNKEDILESN